MVEHGYLPAILTPFFDAASLTKARHPVAVTLIARCRVTVDNNLAHTPASGTNRLIRINAT